MFKKKQALKRGGKVVKKRGGGMMGPKKKMAKGGIAGTMKKALERAKARKPGGRLNVDDIKRGLAAPKGRSAAAKKAAMKGVKGGRGSRVKSLVAKLNQGKGNPAGKDMSMRGKLRSMTLAKLKRKAKK